MKISRNFQGLNKFKPMKKLKHKKILGALITFSVIMILFTVYASAAKQSTQRPAGIQDIAVNLINQEPDPAEPGKYVNVRFKFVVLYY